MKIAELEVSGTRCEVIHHEPIPRGIVGATVSIDYTDSKWESLRKAVIFRGAVTKDVLDAGDEVTIPAEVVNRAGVQVRMGIYGVDAENTIVIPTVWVELGTTQRSAAPSGGAFDPSIPFWTRVQAMIGNLDDLDTDAKSSLVAAVNEALTKGGGIGDMPPEDAVTLLSSADIISPIANADGALYTDGDGKIFVI